jgi:predicted nucleic acid-binding protein
MVVLTRQPVSGRTYSVEEALQALTEWQTACTLLEEGRASVAELFRLIRAHQVRGKQVHDCNIVAVMKVHGVARLATRNGADFQRYGIQVDAVV